MARICPLRQFSVGARIYRILRDTVSKRWKGPFFSYKEDPVRTLDVENPVLASDVEAPHTRTRTVSPVPSNHNNDSHLGRLPAELVLDIFRHCDPGIKARIKITHTCRRWRLIALQNTSLWTQVKIIGPNHRKDRTTFSNFLQLLGMQLDRTGDLLLDVVWMDDVIDEWTSPVLKTLRHKAPLSRWRSLIVCLWGVNAAPDYLFGSDERFTNLQNLAILSRTVEPVIRAIDRLTTSKLQVLDLSDWYSINALEGLYVDSLSNVSTVILPKKHNRFANYHFLPPDVTNVEARWRQSHPFPYLQTYKLLQCNFKRSRPINLRNLTSLVVTAVLEIFAHCEVKLPSLLYLSHARINLGESAKIEAPLLETLHIKVKHPSEITYDERVAMDAAFHHAGYRLSPKRSLVIEWCLAEKPLARLLELCPQVENVSLWFSDSSSVYLTMRRIFGAEAFSPVHTQGGLSGTLCARLRRLELFFVWDTEPTAVAWDVQYRKGVAAEAVKSRTDSSVVPEIYGTWKEVGTSIRLA